MTQNTPVVRFLLAVAALSVACLNDRERPARDPSICAAENQRNPNLTLI